MQRRSFLQSCLGTAASFLCSNSGLLAQNAMQPLAGMAVEPNREELSALLDKLLVTRSPELHRFAVEAYATCILGKIQPPNWPLQHPWIVPGGNYFAQWVWDTMFVVDLLSLLPDKLATIRGVFQNYWDFQERWNIAMPDFMHGMVPNFIAPYYTAGNRNGRQWITSPAYSQAPLLGWGMERVYRRNGDKELLRQGLAGLERFHEWYWRERDIFGLGLIGVGAYSGNVQDGRYETYDHEVDLDDLQMIRFPGRPEDLGHGAWYGDISIPANTSYLLASEQALQRMALVLGDTAMAARRQARHEKGAEAMRKYMWNQELGCFLAVRSKTLEQIKEPSVGSFMPLMAGVPTKEQAAAMAATLATPAWSPAVPVPTIPTTSAKYSGGQYWRGDSWTAPNYQICDGLVAYGHVEDAARIADLTVANALKHGIAERYDSQSGAGIGVPGLGMSATPVTMLLDGLTSDRFVMRVRS